MRRPGRISGRTASKAPSTTSSSCRIRSPRASSARSRRSWSAPRSSARKRKPTESLDAYDYYLRGMANLHQGTREAIDEALPLVPQGDRARSGFRVGLRHGGVVPFLAQDQRLDDRSRAGDRRGCSTGPPRRGAGQGRCGRPRARRPCARPFRRRPRWRHRLDRPGAGAQSESGGGLVSRRLPAESGAANRTTRSSASRAPCV